MAEKDSERELNFGYLPPGRDEKLWASFVSDNGVKSPPPDIVQQTIPTPKVNTVTTHQHEHATTVQPLPSGQILQQGEQSQPCVRQTSPTPVNTLCHQSGVGVTMPQSVQGSRTTVVVTSNPQPAAGEKGLDSNKPKNWKCKTCAKAYIGRKGLERHLRIEPTHESMDAEGEGEMAKQATEERIEDNTEKQTKMEVHNKESELLNTTESRPAEIPVQTNDLSVDLHRQTLLEGFVRALYDHGVVPLNLNHSEAEVSTSPASAVTGDSNNFNVPSTVPSAMATQPSPQQPVMPSQPSQPVKEEKNVQSTIIANENRLLSEKQATKERIEDNTETQNNMEAHNKDSGLLNITEAKTVNSMGSSSSPKSKPDGTCRVAAGSRRVRCGECEKCTRVDCQKCSFCKDMTKYGGPGILKKPCIRRQCLRFKCLPRVQQKKSGLKRKTESEHPRKPKKPLLEGSTRIQGSQKAKAANPMGSSSSPKSKPDCMVAAGSRRVRCGQCENCTRVDCQKCNFCKDMTKYGGPGILKQSCDRRKCIWPTTPNISNISTLSSQTVICTSTSASSSTNSWTITHGNANKKQSDQQQQGLQRKQKQVYQKHQSQQQYQIHPLAQPTTPNISNISSLSSQAVTCTSASASSSINSGKHSHGSKKQSNQQQQGPQRKLKHAIQQQQLQPTTPNIRNISTPSSHKLVTCTSTSASSSTNSGKNTHWNANKKQSDQQQQGQQRKLKHAIQQQQDHQRNQDQVIQQDQSKQQQLNHELGQAKTANPMGSSSSPKSKPGGRVAVGSRRVRCGQCKSCTRVDCQKCSFCKDMKKYGGPGTLKTPCIFRRLCLQFKCLPRVQQKKSGLKRKTESEHPRKPKKPLLEGSTRIQGSQKAKAANPMGSSSSPKSKPDCMVAAGSRRVRCGQCENCTRVDCQKCNFCKDMTKYGGPGILKQSCDRRKCIWPTTPNISNISTLSSQTVICTSTSASSSTNSWTITHGNANKKQSDQQQQGQQRKQKQVFQQHQSQQQYQIHSLAQPTTPNISNISSLSSQAVTCTSASASSSINSGKHSHGSKKQSNQQQQGPQRRLKHAIQQQQLQPTTPNIRNISTPSSHKLITCTSTSASSSTNSGKNTHGNANKKQSDQQQQGQQRKLKHAIQQQQGHQRNQDQVIQQDQSKQQQLNHELGQAHSSSGMSPGIQTLKSGDKCMKRRMQQQDKSELSSPKYRRSIQNQERTTGQVPREALEGIGHVPDVPDAISRGNLKQVYLQAGEPTFIMLDLETTDLIRGGKMPHITQIAAVEFNTGSAFDRYVKPGMAITLEAQQLTGIVATSADTMTVNGNVVNPVSIQSAIQELCTWLEKFQNVFLVAHNGQFFDFPVLVSTLMTLNSLPVFIKCVMGLIDSIKVFKKVWPGQSYKQEDLVHTFLNVNYDAHNAIADVKLLGQLLQYTNLHSKNLISFSFSPVAMCSLVLYDREKARNIGTLDPLIIKGICTRSTAEKIAGSGLQLCHLETINKRAGEDGLRDIFTAKNCDGLPRVTNVKKILDDVLPKLVHFFQNK